MCIVAYFIFMAFIRFFLAAASTLLVIGCSSSRQPARSAAVPFPADTSVPGKIVPLPRARIYKISPEYAGLVPVSISDGRLVSYPAPSDISPATAPLPLADGWILDRQGIGPASSFLKWTRQEYAAMSSAPSPAEILKAVVPGAKISDWAELPMSAAEAVADTAAVNRFITANLR